MAKEMNLVSPGVDMGNDRWNLKTFTGGSDKRNSSWVTVKPD